MQKSDSLVVAQVYKGSVNTRKDIFDGTEINITDLVATSRNNELLNLILRKNGSRSMLLCGLCNVASWLS